jgi:putative endonuclease
VGHTVCQFSARRGHTLALNWHAAQATCDGFARSVGSVSSKQLGQHGEDLAAEHLTRRGFRIVERNYRTRWGELDIIAFDGRVLAFCEVKTRRATSRSPLESIRTLKRSQIRRMASQWLAERRDRPFAEVLRFDAIGVNVDAVGRLVALEHLEGAF